MIFVIIFGCVIGSNLIISFNYMKNYHFILLFFLCFSADSQAQKIQLLQQDTATSIRGLSVVDNQVAWASGSRGHIAITINGGKTRNWQQVKGFEKSDFRDVEAFSEKEAFIMSSGTPALILKTEDGGNIWKVCYRNDDPAYFLDAMDFYNPQRGLVMGDPIKGKFLLIETENQGKTWRVLANAPDALPNEAAFAASGTCLQLVKNRRNAEIVTGGFIPRLLLGKDLRDWSVNILPLVQGQASKGAFSIASGGGYTVIVGGNYQQNNHIDSVACYHEAKSKTTTFQPAQQMPAGFQSCVAYLYNTTFISTGTPGSNITTDGGKNWKQIDTSSFNVCRKARYGSLVLLAGDQGKIAQFKNQ